MLYECISTQPCLLDFFLSSLYLSHLLLDTPPQPPSKLTSKEALYMFHSRKKMFGEEELMEVCLYGNMTNTDTE